MEIDNIQIKYNPNGDARTIDHFPEYDEVFEACRVHKYNMKNVLNLLGNYFNKRAEDHDNSVINNFDSYYVATLAAYNGEANFRESDWFKEHFNDESYRTNRSSPETADLVDLIEGICDHKITTSERIQESPKLLSKDAVYQMYLNTIKKIDESIEVVL